MSAKQHDFENSLIEEGRTVWKASRSKRAALLIDAADYFAALRSAMAAARRSIFILGWDIDSRMRLVGRFGSADDGRPERLLPFLESLVAQRPELEVRLLLWDYTILYALDREPLPSLNLKWRTPPRVTVALDGCLPLGACHHQKIVSVDDNLAFCGGIDLTSCRWDSPLHQPDHPARVNLDGKPYPPFHDVQMAVQGDAARCLTEICARRWREATGEEIPLSTESSLWPDNVAPDFEDVQTGIARTMPEREESAAVTEVLDLYRASIRLAREYIYIETQYLTSDEIVDALIERMAEVPRLELIIVTPRAPDGWLEKRTMGEAQQRAMRRLSSTKFASRIRFLYPWVGRGQSAAVLVHAKLSIVDDSLLQVGSANLNNRSMHVDTECNLVVVARNPADRVAVRSILHRLLGEHLGVDAAQAGAALRRAGSIIEAIDELGHEDRGLAPLEEKGERFALADTLNLVADPEEPIHPTDFIGDMFGAERANRFAFGRVIRLAAVALGLLVLALVWSYTPLADFADPETLAESLYGMRHEWWIYPAVFASFIAGGLVLFPVTVLIAVTGMLLGPWLGWICAITGTMASAWLGYASGVWLGGDSIQQISGRAFRAIAAALRNKGIIAVAALRMVPVAPFTVVNMAMGAAGVGSRIFLAGTFLGMLPGVFVLTMLGDRLRATWRDPGAANILLFSMVIVLWLGLAIALQKLVGWLRKRESRP